jgi:hypothetical protein
MMQRRRTKSVVFIAFSLFTALVIVACNISELVVDLVFSDPPPAYPHYQDKNVALAEAQEISDNLEAYIRAWLRGEVPAEIPDNLIVDNLDNLIDQGTDSGIKNYRLLKPEEVRAEDQWIIRQAQPIDRNALLGGYPDPHVTYLVLGVFYAPFGTKVIMEGEFPHARFFDVQVSPPLDPAIYYFDGKFGSPEVPIVDVDIEPLPGHTNPFLVGADRNATNRSYQLTWTLVADNGPRIEPAFRPPHFRAPGNHRYASAIQYGGPLADPDSEYSQFGHGRGVWESGDFWVRYYAPDLDAGSLGGVELPKVLYELPTGEQFYINADFSEAEQQVNQTRETWETESEEPDESVGPRVGWNHDFGILHNAISALFYGVGKTSPEDKAFGRALELGLTGRGMHQPPPGNYESSASKCIYISYLSREMRIGEGKVAVLTGRLPTTPPTRKGERVFHAAQARYWSLTSYPRPEDWVDFPFIGSAYTSIMDEDIISDSDGWYTIVFSRAENRPQNALPENEVTWVDWGPIATQRWVLRWLTVFPDWKDLKIVPDVTNLPYETTSWLSPQYDPSLMGFNTRNSKLGDYLPVVHYLTTKEFESLGGNLNPQTIPEWQFSKAKGNRQQATGNRQQESGLSSYLERGTLF